MTKDLIRRYGRGELHFITFSCYRRLPLLGSARARNTFVLILDEVRDRYGMALVGYVLMPEHVHLLIGEPARGTPSTAMQVLKQRVSRRLRGRRKVRAGQLELALENGEELPRASGGFDFAHRKQRRFFDFNVWSLKKRVEKLGVHAHEPGEAGTGGTPKGVGVG